MANRETKNQQPQGRADGIDLAPSLLRVRPLRQC